MLPKVRKISLKEPGNINVVDGEHKTYYIGRIAFFHHPKEEINKGYLKLKSFILIEQNAEEAIAKLKRIVEANKAYYSKSNHSFYSDECGRCEGVEVLTECVGIVNFEQLEESFCSGVEIFQEVLTNISRENAYEGVESDSELSNFIEEEVQKGKICLQKAEFMDT